jgi:hypothetical protein
MQPLKIEATTHGCVSMTHIFRGKEKSIKLEQRVGFVRTYSMTLEEKHVFSTSFWD